MTQDNLIWLIKIYPLLDVQGCCASTSSITESNHILCFTILLTNLPCLTKSYWILPNSTESHQTSSDLTESQQISPYLTISYQISANLTESWQISLYFTIYHWISPNLTKSHCIHVLIFSINVPLAQYYGGTCFSQKKNCIFMHNLCIWTAVTTL